MYIHMPNIEYQYILKYIPIYRPVSILLEYLFNQEIYTIKQERMV